MTSTLFYEWTLHSYIFANFANFCDNEEKLYQKPGGSEIEISNELSWAELSLFKTYFDSDVSLSEM